MIAPSRHNKESMLEGERYKAPLTVFYEEKSILIINYDRREGIIQLDRKMKNNSNAGMTLLEVIIAVSIFSISAIVLLQSFVTSSRINKKSNTYLEATSTAQNVMEEIKAKRFQEVALAFNYPVDLTTNSSSLHFWIHSFLKLRIILWRLKKLPGTMMAII